LSKVSIIIPFYNCPYVDTAIDSALNQTYKNIEVIVVNDGSTLHSDKLMPYKNKIKYIEKSNGGTASALNFGIQHAKGEYFTWLSSDDVFHPEKIEKQLQFMKSMNAKASYSNFYLINEQGIIISPPQGVRFQNYIQFLKRMRRGCVINGCTVMLEMNLLEEFGRFDETLLYTQDYDYWLRILPRYTFHYYPEPLVNYRVHDQMGTKKHRIEIRQEMHNTIQRHSLSMNHLIKNAVQNGI
jgi:glycosyltransferase involved in cell wall biosynthesis